MQWFGSIGAVRRSYLWSRARDLSFLVIFESRLALEMVHFDGEIGLLFGDTRILFLRMLFNLCFPMHSREIP